MLDKMPPAATHQEAATVVSVGQKVSDFALELIDGQSFDESREESFQSLVSNNFATLLLFYPADL
ncbi:MAG: hypothetical protein MHMPM18_002655 [Marteilia pararefringens]